MRSAPLGNPLQTLRPITPTAAIDGERASMLSRNGLEKQNTSVALDKINSLVVQGAIYNLNLHNLINKPWKLARPRVVLCRPEAFRRVPKLVTSLDVRFNASNGSSCNATMVTSPIRKHSKPYFPVSLTSIIVDGSTADEFS